MKKIIPIAALLCIGLITFNTLRLQSFSSVPPAVRTGAPNEQTCAVSGCHDSGGGVNIGTGTVSITPSGLDSGYILDSIYTIDVRVDDNTKTIFGFELTALDSTHNPAGLFQNIGSNTTTISGTAAGKTRRYVSHKNANNVNTWSFKWKAPSTNQGKVIFYASGNAANGNGGDSGDLIYTNSIEISVNPKQVVDTTTNSIASLKQSVFISQNSTTFRIANPNQERLSLKVFNSAGVMVSEIYTQQASEIFEKNAFSTGSGIYFLMISSGNAAFSEKLIIL